MSNDSRRPKGSPGGTGGQFDTRPGGDAAGLPSLAHRYSPMDGADLHLHFSALEEELRGKAFDYRQRRALSPNEPGYALPPAEGGDRRGLWIPDSDMPDGEGKAFTAWGNGVDPATVAAAWGNDDELDRLTLVGLTEHDGFCYHADHMDVGYTDELGEDPVAAMERAGCDRFDPRAQAARNGVNEGLVGRPDIDMSTAPDGKGITVRSTDTGRSMDVSLSDRGRTLRPAATVDGLPARWRMADYLERAERETGHGGMTGKRYRRAVIERATADQWHDMTDRLAAVLERT